MLGRVPARSGLVSLDKVSLATRSTAVRGPRQRVPGRSKVYRRSSSSYSPTSGAPPSDPPRFFPGKTTGGGGEGNEEDTSDSLLSKAEVAVEDLPADIQEAYNDGRLSTKDLAKWLRLANVPLLGSLCRLMPGFRDRILGNPKFLTVLGLEMVLGCGGKLASELNFRGEDFGKEKWLVASDLALELIADVSCVVLLSGKVSFKPRPTRGLAAWTSSLPGHAFQVGDYSLGSRVSVVAWRGLQFLAVGAASSAVGHTLTRMLVQKQQEEEGGAAEDAPKLAPVHLNSAAWGGFMAVVGNARYQVVNCIEDRALAPYVAQPLARTALTAGLRFTNCYVGGLQWMWFMGKIGLQ